MPTCPGPTTCGTTEASLPLNRAGRAEDIVVPGGAHTLFPGRAESVLGYARRLRDGYLLTLEALSIVGLLALAWLVHELVTSYDAGRERVRRATVGRGGSDPGLVHRLGLGHAAGGGRCWRCSGWRPPVPERSEPVNTRTILRWLGVLALLVVVAVVAFALDWGLAEGGADRPRSGRGAAPGAGALSGATAAELPEAAPEPGIPAARRRGGAADHPQQPRVCGGADPGRRGGCGSGGRRAQPLPQVAALGRAERCTARRWWRWASSPSPRWCW